MINVMVDLETYGSTPGCVIRSIGAVAFTLDGGPLIPDLYQNVTLASCLDAGLRVEAETEAWWRARPRVTREALEADAASLLGTLLRFTDWYRSVAASHLWCHGASFDVPVLACAYRAVRLSVPWDHRTVRDTRTLYDLVGFDPAMVARVGDAHNALADAIYQAECVVAALTKLRGAA